MFEGIDGSGKDTQVEIFKGKFDIYVRFPEYRTPSGVAIKYILEGRIPYSPEMMVYLNLLNMKEVTSRLDFSKKILANRYFSSTLAYNCADVEKCLRAAELIGIPKPDLIVLIDVAPETAISRISGRDEKHIFETAENLRVIRERFLYLAKNNVFSRWVVINGEKSIQEVTEDISNVLNL
ncbi:MAG: hypothetical protein GXO63_00985 [Candidatus Micrarchaeota archaeon]|nr:hypothetical protein [Candidatus Micrarchaeota archaeon]